MCRCSWQGREWHAERAQRATRQARQEERSQRRGEGGEGRQRRPGDGDGAVFIEVGDGEEDGAFLGQWVEGGHLRAEVLAEQRKRDSMGPFKKVLKSHYTVTS